MYPLSDRKNGKRLSCEVFHPVGSNGVPFPLLLIPAIG
jgi:hypothetical protein